MSVLDDESDDPVRRTRRQLQCYYRCVARDEGALCPTCKKCDDHCTCDDDEEDEWEPEL